MKESHFLRLQSQKNETQSQKMRLASSHRRPGGLQRKRFLASLMLRRPEQICFSPSTSFDAPNKFVFAHPQASTPRTNLFFSIHELRRPEQICFCPSTSFDAPNKFVFLHP